MEGAGWRHGCNSFGFTGNKYLLDYSRLHYIFQKTIIDLNRLDGEQIAAQQAPSRNNSE